MKHNDWLHVAIRYENFSALGRAVWDETSNSFRSTSTSHANFSALGRAVWDETRCGRDGAAFAHRISVLSVEPYGMKRPCGRCGGGRVAISVLSVEPYGMKLGDESGHVRRVFDFSALGRAVWDETLATRTAMASCTDFSALGRAVWDETGSIWRAHHAANGFQCSRSSRMG